MKLEGLAVYRKTGEGTPVYHKKQFGGGIAADTIFYSIEIWKVCKSR